MMLPTLASAVLTVRRLHVARGTMNKKIQEEKWGRKNVDIVGTYTKKKVDDRKKTYYVIVV